MTAINPVAIFRVREIQDSERLGKVVGYFTTGDKAKIAAKGKGAWGSEGEITPAWALPAEGGKFHILEQQEPLELDVDFVAFEKAARDAALAKLTPDERQLLGISA
jgi:hypothetical protein